MRSRLAISAVLVVVLQVGAARALLGPRAFGSDVGVILLLGGVGCLLVLGLALSAISRLLSRITEVEIALLEATSGSGERAIALRGDALDGLAHRVNHLLESQRALSHAPELASVEAASPTSHSALADDPGLAARLAAEDEEAYRSRVFGEYVAAKRALGDDASGIDRERFIKGLVANAERTSRKLGVGRVRFSVRSEGGVVSLDPIPIDPGSRI